jgi:hypothetical protein
MKKRTSKIVGYKCWKIFICLLLLSVLSVGCGDDDNGTTEPTTYSVSDLEGTWLGDLAFTFADGSSRTESNVGFSFNSQGNATNWMIPNVVSISGNLSVSELGEISGTLYGVNIVDVENNIQDTTTMNVQGNFTSKSSMDIVLACTYTRSDGTGGSYTASGILFHQ